MATAAAAPADPEDRQERFSRPAATAHTDPTTSHATLDGMHPSRAAAAYLSLVEGPLVPTVEILIVVVLLLAIGWRTRRFRLRTLPVVAVLGVAGGLGAWLSFRDDGLATDPAPATLWFWCGLVVVALAVAVLGWPSARWWRRAVAVLAVPLCLLGLGLELNAWVGYFRTVPAAYAQLTAAPLPDEVTPQALAAMRGTPRTTGAVVPITIPPVPSGFDHRTEYVYLPPAWFAGPTPPRLPAVIMLGGEFSTPQDWMRTGDVVPTMDDYARTHGGVTPILVFADAAGAFNNDTECVDGPRGNAADHLTEDLEPYVEAHFGASDDPRGWGVVGWSTGGTCALDLAVMHPEVVDTFVDIAGDAGPNDGTQAQTIARLYGGDAAAWAHFDPATVLAVHPPYADTAGWFDDSSNQRVRSAAATPRTKVAPDDGGGFGGKGAGASVGDQLPAAEQLCAQARTKGIACDVHTQRGTHSWTFASKAFPLALPWLAQRLGTPTAPPAVPGAVPTTVLAAGRG